MSESGSWQLVDPASAASDGALKDKLSSDPKPLPLPITDDVDKDTASKDDEVGDFPIGEKMLYEIVHDAEEFKDMVKWWSDTQVSAFKVVVRGGPGTFSRSGVFNDTVRVEPRTAAVGEWCKWYGFTVTHSFSLRKYGQELGQALAYETARKLDFVHSIWVDNGARWGHSYTNFEINSYVEDPSFTRLVEPLGPHHQFAPKVASIRGLWPSH